MNYRPFYLEIRGTINAERPLHVGASFGSHPLTDSPIFRQNGEQSSDPAIPGSSLKGLMRAHVEREKRLLGVADSAFHSLFGFANSETQPIGSLGRLRVYDAVRSASGRSGWIRDHVRIDSNTGAAAHQAKFDEEVTPAETTFSFFAIYEGGTAKDDDLILLGEAIRALEHGELRAGAKSGWGYGKICLVGTEYRCFQRDNAAGLKAFLRHRLRALAIGRTLGGGTGEAGIDGESFEWPTTALEAPGTGDLALAGQAKDVAEKVSIPVIPEHF